MIVTVTMDIYVDPHEYWQKYYKTPEQIRDGIIWAIDQSDEGSPGPFTVCDIQLMTDDGETARMEKRG
jgi:hypothetical protein